MSATGESKPEWMEWFPMPGWRSVDEKGRLPPGQRPFKRLPPGVKPAISPEDKERKTIFGNVVTVTKASEIPAQNDPMFAIAETRTDWFWHITNRLPDKIRKWYNSCAIFDTEPMYHIPQVPVTPIWDCDINDTICAADADRRALSDKRVEFTMLKTMATRLESCHRETCAHELIQEYRNEGYDIQCGPLEQTLREMEAAYELKWGRINSIAPILNMAKLTYMKQKNRFIEDRFRHRMMANVGAKPNEDTVSEKNRWRIDGPDERPYDPDFDKIKKGDFSDVHLTHFDFAEKAKWDKEAALQVEAEKRYKAAKAAAEE